MKPKKPYKDFPLLPHANGQWAKKIHGKLHYFGTWDDPGTAESEYEAQRSDLQAGRTPKRHRGGLTVRGLVNRFLEAKKSLLDSSELSPRTWSGYYTTCENIIDQFGRLQLVLDLTGEDFEQFRAKLAKTRGPVALANEVQRVRTVFKFAWDDDKIERPVRFGSVFKKPARRLMRQARFSKGKRMIQAAELRKLIDSAGVPMKAMILLAVNCGFGQTDVACLPVKALDLAGGWVNFPRPKTENPRRCPLWPETAAALREAIDKRPEHKRDADAGLEFITKHGARWVRVNEKKGDDGADKAGVVIDSVRLEFNKLLAALELKREGLGFYALRHTFATIAGDSKDQIAVDTIMGHVREDMASVYRESVEDARLEAVTKVVHDWLWPIT